MTIENDMRIDNVVAEDVSVVQSSTLHLHGIVNGDVYVRDNARFYLHGMLNGNLLTEKNASSYVYGIMNGTVLPGEGAVELSGMLRTDAPVPESLVKKAGCCINDKRF